MKENTKNLIALFDQRYAQAMEHHIEMRHEVNKAHEAAKGYAWAQAHYEQALKDYERGLRQGRDESELYHPSPSNPYAEKFDEAAARYGVMLEKVRGLAEQASSIAGQVKKGEIQVREMGKGIHSELRGREVGREATEASGELLRESDRLAAVFDEMQKKLKRMADVPKLPDRDQYVSKPIRIEMPRFVTNGIRIISRVGRGIVKAAVTALAIAGAVIVPVALSMAHGAFRLVTGMGSKLFGPTIGSKIPRMRPARPVTTTRQTSLREFGFANTSIREGRKHRFQLFRKPKKTMQTTLSDFRPEGSKSRLFDPKNPKCNVIHPKKRNGFQFFKRIVKEAKGRRKGSMERIMINDEGAKLKIYNASEFGSKDWGGWMDKSQKRKFRQAPDPKIQPLTKDHDWQQSNHTSSKAAVKDGMKWLESGTRKAEAASEIRQAIEKIQSEPLPQVDSGWKKLLKEDALFTDPNRGSVSDPAMKGWGHVEVKKEPLFADPDAGTIHDPLFKGYLDQVKSQVDQLDRYVHEPPWVKHGGRPVTDYDVDLKVRTQMDSLMNQMRYEGGYDSVLNDHHFIQQLHDHVKRNLKMYREQVTQDMLDSYDYQGNASRYVSDYMQGRIGW